MKVYNRIIMSIATGKTIEEDSFEYSGPILLCKGGGGGGDPDYLYNARMAAISEKNQGYADEMFNVFKFGVPYNPHTSSGETKLTGKKIPNPEWDEWNRRGGPIANVYDDTTGMTERGRGPAPPKFIDERTEILNAEMHGYDPKNTVSEMDLMMKEIETEYGLLPVRAETEKMELRATQELIPLQTGLQKAGIEDQMKNIRERAPVISSFYEEALSGVDVEERVGQARAGVHQAFTQTEEITKRNMARLGVDPTSGAAASAFKDVGIHKASALAGAGTAAREGAERESFERKRQAVGMGLGV